MIESTIAFFGAGNMASSLIHGLIAHSVAPASIWATDIDREKLNAFAAASGIRTGEPKELAAAADVIVLAVKPQSMKQLCLDLADHLTPEQLIVSIAAGITAGQLGSWLSSQGKVPSVVRCMPNTPALVGKGASGLFATSGVNRAQRSVAERIVNSVGLSVWVERESDIDAVTAVSGSGPAYFFLFMESMQAAAIDMGLSPETARVLTQQTALGAAQLALSSEDDIAELRRKVTSPGGTTERAINSMEAADLRKLVDKAMKAAQTRSVELSDEFGK